MSPVAILIAGHVLWIVAYATSIMAGFRARLVAFPILAILLNITWEYNIVTDCGLFEVHLFDSGFAEKYCRGGLTDVMLWLMMATIALDAVLLLQAVAWGSGGRDGHSSIQMAGIVLLGLCGGLAFHVVLMIHAGSIFPYPVLWHGDYRGVFDAWLINFLMSLLFLDLLRKRPNGEGLSRIAAWTKLLGSAFNAAFLLTPAAELRPPRDLMIILFVAVFVIDLIYALWLHRAKMGVVAPAPALS